MQLSQTVLLALLLATAQCVQEDPIKHTSHHKRAETAPLQFSVQTTNPHIAQIPIQLDENIPLAAAGEAPFEAESFAIRPFEVDSSEAGPFESDLLSGEEEQDKTTGGMEIPTMDNHEQEDQETEDIQAVYGAPVQSKASIMTSIPVQQMQKTQQSQQAKHSHDICNSQHAPAAINYTRPAYYQVPVSSSQAEESSTTALKFAFPPRRAVSSPRASRPPLLEINVVEQTQIPQQQYSSQEVQDIDETRPVSKVPIIKEELAQMQAQQSSSPCLNQAQEFDAQTMMPFSQSSIQQDQSSSAYTGCQQSVAAWYSYFMPSSKKAQMANVYNLTHVSNANVTMLFKLERNHYEYQHAQQFCSTKSPGVYCYVPFACGSTKCLSSAMISCPDGVILRCSEGYSCSNQTTADSSTGSSAQCLALKDLVPSTFSRERAPRLLYPDEESPAFEVSVGGRRQIIAPQRCLGPLPHLFDRMAHALERAKATIHSPRSASSTSDQQLQILQGGLLAGRRAVRSAGAIISPQAIIIGPREIAHRHIGGRILGAPRQSPAMFTTEQSAQEINPESPEDVAFLPIQQQQAQIQPQSQTQIQPQAQTEKQTNQQPAKGALENLILGSPIVSSGSGKRDPVTRKLYAQGQQQEQIYPQQEIQDLAIQQPYQFITGAPQSRPRRSFEACRIY